MEKLNQTIIIQSEDKHLDCEIVREHLIPQWDEKEYNSFKSCVDNALKSYRTPNGEDTPEIEDVIFKQPKKPVEDIDNHIKKIVVTEKEPGEIINAGNEIRKYTIEVGLGFYCLEKKMNCTIVRFEPFDYGSDDELLIIVEYENGQKGTSFIDQLSPI